jgi:NADH-quinone oxidoreductase subunit I
MSEKKPPYPLGVAIYLKEIARGLAITLRHIVRNLLFRENVVTVEYPDERKPQPEFYRGRHVLLKRENGEPRCVACFLCATNCPAQCIHIEAGEHPDPKIERFPVKYEIDFSRCVFCGFCVEACPKDAIAMTHDYELAEISRYNLTLGKEALMRLPKGEKAWLKQKGKLPK